MATVLTNTTPLFEWAEVSLPKTVVVYDGLGDRAIYQSAKEVMKKVDAQLDQMKFDPVTERSIKTISNYLKNSKNPSREDIENNCLEPLREKLIAYELNCTNAKLKDLSLSLLADSYQANNSTESAFNVASKISDQSIKGEAILSIINKRMEYVRIAYAGEDQIDIIPSREEFAKRTHKIVGRCADALFNSFMAADYKKACSYFIPSQIKPKPIYPIERSLRSENNYEQELMSWASLIALCDSLGSKAAVAFIEKNAPNTNRPWIHSLPDVAKLNLIGLLAPTILSNPNFDATQDIYPLATEYVKYGKHEIFTSGKYKKTRTIDLSYAFVATSCYKRQFNQESQNGRVDDYTVKNIFSIVDRIQNEDLKDDVLVDMHSKNFKYYYGTLREYDYESLRGKEEPEFDKVFSSWITIFSKIKNNEQRQRMARVLKSNLENDLDCFYQQKNIDKINELFSVIDKELKDS